MINKLILMLVISFSGVVCSTQTAEASEGFLARLLDRISARREMFRTNRLERVGLRRQQFNSSPLMLRNQEGFLDIPTEDGGIERIWLFKRSRNLFGSLRARIGQRIQLRRENLRVRRMERLNSKNCCNNLITVETIKIIRVN